MDGIRLERELIFKIITGEEGRPKTIRECKIYSDGTVEGYPRSFLGIFNGHFSILNRELAKLKLEYEQAYGGGACPSRRLNDSEGGSSQGTAE